MKIDIVSKTKQAALGREELSFEIKDSKVPPSRKEVRESLAALTDSKPDNVIVEKISTRFGTTNFGGIARVYKNIENLEKTELKYLKNRNRGIKEEKKKEEEQPAPKKK